MLVGRQGTDGPELTETMEADGSEDGTSYKL